MSVDTVEAAPSYCKSTQMSSTSFGLVFMPLCACVLEHWHYSERHFVVHRHLLHHLRGSTPGYVWVVDKHESGRQLTNLAKVRRSIVAGSWGRDVFLKRLSLKDTYTVTHKACAAVARRHYEGLGTEKHAR